MNRRGFVECRNGTWTSPQSSPSDEEVIRRRLGGHRHRMSKPQAADSAVDNDKPVGRDLLRCFSPTRNVECDAEDVIGVAGILTDNRQEESDEDSASTCSSIVSGPVARDSATPEKLCLPPDLCPTCLALYENAMMDKAPIKDKLLDNDPTSLTCDQWVLLKKWTRGSNLKGKFLSRLQFGKRVGENESPDCSRPHPFLQRNLRFVTKSPKKPRRKKDGRKRAKSSRKLFPVKRRRVHGKNGSHHDMVSCTDVVSNGSLDLDSLAEADLSGEVIFSSVTVKSSRLKAAEPNRLTEAKGFRNLLSQSRGSMIVKETHH